MPINLDHILEPNEKYGSGLFRRRILLQKFHHKILCELEDYCHGFRVIVHHDGTLITDIDATTIRAPVDICFNARDAIIELVGQPLKGDRKSLANVSHPTNNCTHIYDLVVLALAHAARNTPTRLYDIEVDVEKNGILHSRAILDGSLIHRWQVNTDDLIESPEDLMGCSVMRGTGKWINQKLTGDASEAAKMLVRGLLVAGSRRWNLAAKEGASSAEFGPGPGVCYTYSTARVNDGRRISNSLRDFSDTPEQLLKFR